MNGKLCGVIVVFLILSIFQEYQRQTLIQYFPNLLSHDRWSFRFGTLFYISLLILVILHGGNLPMIFLVLLATHYIPYTNGNYMDLILQTGKILVTMATTLILFSIIRICGFDMSNASDFIVIRLGSLCIAQVFNILLYHILHRVLSYYDNKNNYDPTRQKAYLRFLIFCCIACYIDALLCMLNNDSFYVPITLLFSNALTLLLAIAIMYFNNRSSIQKQIENEYNKLESQKAMQNWYQQKLMSMAQTDALTGTYSRRYVIETLDLFSACDTPYFVVYIDMDDMKLVNDQFGHAAGDLYLINFTMEVKRRLPQDSFLARMGGDEFVIVFTNTTKSVVSACMQKISQQLTDYSFTYGIAADIKDSEEMLRTADAMMYRAKRRKKEGA